jgi:transposase-like protein
MKGHGSKFGKKKEAAIAALLTERNQAEAARSVGINLSTLKRWMREPGSSGLPAGTLGSGGAGIRAGSSRIPQLRLRYY